VRGAVLWVTTSRVIVARDPIGYLGTFLGERQSCALQPHDVVYVLKTLAREISPLVSSLKHDQMSLFADWVVHGKLDRSKEGQAAIATIAEALLQHGEVGRDNKWIEEVVNDALSFGALRVELLQACQHFGLPESLFATWESWQRFALPLAFEVSGRRIRLGSKASRTIKGRVAASGLPPHHQPCSLGLVLDTSVNGQAWWQIETPVAMLNIQVLYGGFRSADFPTPASAAAGT
jgi:hypothetical protein